MLRAVKTWGGQDAQVFIQSKDKISDSRQGSTIKHHCPVSALCMAYQHLEDLTNAGHITLGLVSYKDKYCEDPCSLGVIKAAISTNNAECF